MKKILFTFIMLMILAAAWQAGAQDNPVEPAEPPAPAPAPEPAPAPDPTPVPEPPTNDESGNAPTPAPAPAPVPEPAPAPAPAPAPEPAPAPTDNQNSEKTQTLDMYKRQALAAVRGSNWESVKSNATKALDLDPGNKEFTDFLKLADENLATPNGMAYVPAGAFIMGTNDEESAEYCKPGHEVVLAAYYIDLKEVTNAEFAKFVTETSYKTDAEKRGYGWIWDNGLFAKCMKADWKHPRGADSSIEGKDNFPVVQVTWNDAVNYAKWAGKELPTEAQWEKAARGTTGYIYPWGNEYDKQLLNSADRGATGTWEAGHLDSYTSPYGLRDMAGNVWEWCLDRFKPEYYGSSPRENPAGPVDGNCRVVRGGCWQSAEKFVRTCSRSWVEPEEPYETNGFRCVKNITAK
jgi:formylglycine-generating enzyme required for sulfatase activity